MFGCANEAGPIDGDTHGGNRPPSDCPTGGTSCSGEGAVCGENMCHCGTWMNRGNPACSQACTQPPPDTTSCTTGMACSGEGIQCANGNICHCGRWTPPSLTDTECPGGTRRPTCNDLTCPAGTYCEPRNGGLACVPTNTGGTGGSGGNAGSGGSGGSPAMSCDTVRCPEATHCTEESGDIECVPNVTTTVGTHDVTITIHSGEPVDHIYCEGGEVAQGDLSKDTSAQWYTGWYSFGCDSFDGSYSCTVQVHNDRDMRFQCYLKAPESLISGDRVRYTCSDVPLHSGESFTVSGPYSLVQNLDPEFPGKNCQVD